MIDYFQDNLVNFSKFRTFITQNDDETVLANETDNVWDPKWCQGFLTYQTISQVQQSQPSQFIEII